MKAETFKKLVKRKGGYEVVGEQTGYSPNTIRALCEGWRNILQRHIEAVKSLEDAQ